MKYVFLLEIVFVSVKIFGEQTAWLKVCRPGIDFLEKCFEKTSNIPLAPCRPEVNLSRQY